jgi:hypothetical protein
MKASPKHMHNETHQLKTVVICMITINPSQEGSKTTILRPSHRISRLKKPL